MNNRKQIHYWIVDAILFVAFIVAFFLNLTGLSVHQWIGVAVEAIIVYHLLTHWSWVTAVTRRFFGSTSGKARIYYLLDAIILVGMIMIGLTGLIISTWLNLYLPNYPAWVDVHIISSVLTLLAVALKISLHSRWILATTRNVFATRPVVDHQPANASLAIATQSVLQRRDFLKLMGVVGIASFIAASQALQNLLPENSENTEAVGSDLSTTSNEVAVNEASSSVAEETFDNILPTAAPTTENTSANNNNAIQPTLSVDSSSGTSSTTSCTTSCPFGRHCSYPGRCRRYIDTNGNNLCDHGECL